MLHYLLIQALEYLNIKLINIDIIGREIIITTGKGNKQRVVDINDKIINSLREWLKIRDKLRYKDSEYLFISRQSEKINRTRINNIFKKVNPKITPHKLRHFWCTRAIEVGYAIQEVAYQAGHSDIRTTTIYTHQNRLQMKRKANLL